MKRIWVAFWIFATLSGLCLIEIFTVNQMAKNLYFNLEQIKGAIFQKDSQKALSIAKNLEKQWENDQKTLSLFMEHIKLEYVGQALVALLVNLEQKRYEETLLEAAKIREYINTIQDGEIPHLYNLI